MLQVPNNICRNFYNNTNIHYCLIGHIMPLLSNSLVENMRPRLCGIIIANLNSLVIGSLNF